MSLDQILVVSMFLVGAVILTVLVIFGAERKQASKPRAEPTPVAYLFEGGSLIHATPLAHDILEDLSNDITWSALRDVFAIRFPNLPTQMPSSPGGVVDVAASDPKDLAILRIETSGQRVHVELIEGEPDMVYANHHKLRSAEILLDHMTEVCESAPVAMWRLDENGALTWCNRVYSKLMDAAKDRDEPLMPAPSLETAAGRHRARTNLASETDDRMSWYDVTVTDAENGKLFHASNIDAVIQAEIAQRNFVQTLAKTFAQLSIGLAIFDRNRQLVLFNPALVDLTGLRADFLSARPELLTFFDNLRDRRIMPEPKNYAEWRQEIARVISAASDGHYEETWSLLNGKTYRVIGRPHPDGAVAFLLEDISAEVSQTRNYRHELEQSRSLLDSLDDALVVFSDAGEVTYANAAYRNLWDHDPQRSFVSTKITDCIETWQSGTQDQSVWIRVESVVLHTKDRSDWQATIRDQTGRNLSLFVSALPARATLVRFRVDTESVQLPAKPI